MPDWDEQWRFPPSAWASGATPVASGGATQWIFPETIASGEWVGEPTVIQHAPTLTPEARRVLAYLTGGASGGLMVGTPFGTWWAQVVLALSGAILAVALRDNAAVRRAVQTLAELLGRLRA